MSPTQLAAESPGNTSPIRLHYSLFATLQLHYLADCGGKTCLGAYYCRTGVPNMLTRKESPPGVGLSRAYVTSFVMADLFPMLTYVPWKVCVRNVLPGARLGNGYLSVRLRFLEVSVIGWLVWCCNHCAQTILAVVWLFHHFVIVTTCAMP